MGLDAGTPPGLRETIQRIAEEAVAKFARSGFLRNASISDGGLTIKGGFLRLLTKAVGGVNLLYAGPSGAPLPDGSYQQVIVISRADGSQAFSLFDAFPGADGTLNQAWTLRDRAGNAVFADDTDSGQGIARPYIPIVFYPAQFGGSTSTTSTSFTTIWRASAYKLQPQLIVGAAAVTTGTTGELRVLVNGQVMGTVQPVTTAGSSYVVGPLPVAGDHLSSLAVEIQVRCVGAGSINVVPNSGSGYQS